MIYLFSIHSIAVKNVETIYPTTSRTSELRIFRHYTHGWLEPIMGTVEGARVFNPINQSGY